MASALYGTLAEFATPEALVDAALRSRTRGYRALEAFAPFSIEGLPETLGFTRNRVAPLALIGGVVGGAGAWFMQWYSAVIDYPINAGGRPLNSWPAFVPAMFELAVLGAALAAFIGAIVMNGLPRLYHPVFNVPEFDLASQSRFFLCIRSTDPAYLPDEAARFLRTLGACRVMAVPMEDA